MNKIFITRHIPDAGPKALKTKGYAVDIYKKDDVIVRKELLKRVKGCDALLSLLTDKIDEEVLKAAGPKLKIIANYAVGFDNVDLAAAKKYGVIVTNTPAPEVSETVAEHAMALLFALAHRIVESDHLTRQGKYHGWNPNLLLGTDVTGKTLGVIGTGRIGMNLVRRLNEGFGIRTLYSDVKRNKELEKISNAKFVTLNELLMRSDFVSIHAPLLPSTHHLISTKQFRLMKKTAYLINTSRGSIVDSHALVQALKTKRIAGAALDVFEGEPAFALRRQDSTYLQHAWNVILTPHTASATIEARQAMSKLAADNIIAVLSGKPPLTPAK
ncbi:MAG: D-glycerate dehydrogenase [Candidatus Uhrbacteria bacterium]|nr:D-glycerate dehydrogenase [Candidatus Uhrbacteria bacterium]